MRTFFLCGYFQVAVFVNGHHDIAVVVRAINLDVVRFKSVQRGLARMIELVSVGIATYDCVFKRISSKNALDVDVSLP